MNAIKQDKPVGQRRHAVVLDDANFRLEKAEVIDGKAELVVRTLEQQRELDALRAWSEERKKIAADLGVPEESLVLLW